MGSFRPNGFGLYDMPGNVWERMIDYWNSDFNGAPTDGSAWTNRGYARRVVRGGSWLHFPGALRSAFRSWNDTDDQNFVTGFRVAVTF